MAVGRRHTPWAVTAIAALMLLAGCQNGSGDTQPGGEAAPSEAQPSEERQPDVASTENATAAMPEHGDPVGYCGDIDFHEPTAVYLGHRDITCPQARELAEQVADEKGVEDESGDGMIVGKWSCGYGPADDPLPAYSMICWLDEAKQKSVLFRPAGLTVQPGVHRNPHDFEQGYGTAFFTTPAKRFYCSISAESMGCDVHQDWPPGVPEIYDEMMGEKGVPTAIVLDAQGPPEFAIFGDPAHTNFNENGGIDDVNPVLGYGEVLYFAGFSCTADKDRGVVCAKGKHGFEMSSKKFTTH